MKEKCESLRISIVITVVSLLLCVLLWLPFSLPFPDFVVDFFKMLCGGILGSSFVTLFIYWSEYKTQKRITLLNIYSEAQKINEKFKQIQILYISYPVEIVEGYFYEEWNNEQFSSFNNKQNHSYFNQWIQILHREYKGLVPDNILNDICEDAIKSKAKEYLDDINKAIDSYIKISNMDWNEYKRLFGSVDFFAGKKYYTKLYSDLYEPFKQKFNLVQEQIHPHFLMYKSGENKNRAVILFKIVELQSNFFSMEYAKYGLCIYNDFYSEMDKKLEDFWVSIHKNVLPEYQDRLLVMNIQSFVKFD